MSVLSESDNESEISNITPRTLLRSMKSNKDFVKKPNFLTIIQEVFLSSFEARTGDSDSQSKILKFVIQNVIQKDLLALDKLDTIELSLMDSIYRQRLRMKNRKDEIIAPKYLSSTFDIVNFCKSLLSEYTYSLVIEIEGVMMMFQVMRLVRIVMEYGLWHEPDLQKLIKVLFIRTEQLHKQEEYLSKSIKAYDRQIYQILRNCKDECTSILLQITTMANDSWLYNKVKNDTFKTQEKLSRIIASEKPESGIEITSLKEFIDEDDPHSMFLLNNLFYSNFSFIMFNYLLRGVDTDKSGAQLSEVFKVAMNSLLSVVFDPDKDTLLSSNLLLKKEYLSYYFNDNLDEEYVVKAKESIADVKSTTNQYKLMRLGGQANILDSSNVIIPKYRESLNESGQFTDEGNEVNLEKKTSLIFSRLEVLLGLQDETFGMRLMFTELRMPYYILCLLCEIDNSLKGDLGEEVFVRGLKILYQLTKGNYPAQLQLTKGDNLEQLNNLIKGDNGVLVLLFFSEVFNHDSLFLKLNTRFTTRLFEILKERIDDFYLSFTDQKNTTSKSLVELYIFLQFISIFIKDSQDTPHRFIRSFNLRITQICHNLILKFVIPLLKGNQLEIQKYYEPKLIKKTWTFENCFSLSALMMLSGEHKRSMLMDFAYKFLKLYNESTARKLSGDIIKDISGFLPNDLSCFDYLFEFPEGLLFRTEILVLYNNFRVFPKCSKIGGEYTKQELSPEAEDTFLDYLPRDHLTAIPVIINEELDKFAQLDLENYEQSDILEYLIKGIFQMIYKYSKGVNWFANGCDNDDIILKFANHFKRINSGIFRVKKILQYIQQDSRSGVRGDKKRRTAQHIPFMSNEILSQSVTLVISSIEQIFESTKYHYILNYYHTSESKIQTKQNSSISSFLSNEASYINYSKQSSRRVKPMVVKKEATSDKLALRVESYLIFYRKIKQLMLKNVKLNTFFQILQSKMENTNQRNLVSYLIKHLSDINFEVGQEESLWNSNEALDIIVFLNNTVYWCSKTRIAIYVYFNENTEQGLRFLSLIYKGLRDSMTYLLYSPFHNEDWEFVWSRFYIFSSFIQGLCKENSQKFKRYFGSKRPIIPCKQFTDGGLTFLEDFQSCLLKYLWFSGLSRNKSNEIIFSDKLCTVFTIERGIRCLIDMLTGPCEQNQQKLYMGGTQIWLNILTRAIRDLNSDYYYLMSVVLDYILSLLEGNNKDILEYFSSAFDIPLMYNFIVILIMNLRVLVKQSIVSTSGDESIKESEEESGSILFRSKMSVFKRFSFTHRKLSRDNQVGQATQIIGADAKKFEVNKRLGWGDEEKESSNWQELIDMYRLNKFDGHIVLKCSIQIYRFLNRVAYRSRKYQIFFDTKERGLEEKYAEAGFTVEDIHSGSARLTGEANSDDALLVYYFMKNVTSRIEILDKNKISQIFIFLKPPCCFFLSPKTVDWFQKNCDIDSTESKLLDVFDSFEGFYTEMQNYMIFISKYPRLGSLLNGRAFTVVQGLCWILCLGINLVYLYRNSYRDFQVLEVEQEYIIVILIISILVIFMSLIMILLWIIATYPIVLINEIARFKKKNPFKNPKSVNNFISIRFINSIMAQTEVMGFLLHVVFCTLGLISNSVFHSFNLFMIVNISDTSRYVLKAITAHYDQLVTTIFLVSIFVFAYSNFMGQYYGELINTQMTDGLHPCETLKSCFFNTLDLGLRFGGGIAETMVMTGIDDPHINFYYKIAFSLSFFLFVNVICLNIIFGIIIDTFAELRAKRKERDWSTENKCDICGIERRFFEKRGFSFRQHKLSQHSLWDYVFYLVYLKTVEKETLTGFEFYVLQQYQANNTAWLPIKNTQYLNFEEEEKGAFIKKIEGSMLKMEERLEKKIDSRFKEIINLIKQTQ